MSLLGSLVTQIASSAMDPDDAQRNPVNQSSTTHRTGGLGDILGSVLGGSVAPPSQADNGFGLDDVLGGLGGLMGGSQQSNTGGIGDILGSVLGAQRSSGGGKGLLVATLLPIVLKWVQNNGGLSGALSKITSMGYDNQARSWMSNNEQNDNLDPNEINRLFDDNDIQQVATKTGANDMEVRQGLAELLPEVLNKLTPNGNLEMESEANQEIDQIINQLSGRLGAFK